MTQHINDNTRLSDDRLKELFKKELPQAPRNPWFVRKVINRLPEKEAPACSRIEYICYAVAAVCLAAAWCHLTLSIRAAGQFTGGDLIYLLVLASVSVAIAIGFVAPRIRSWLTES